MHTHNLPPDPPDHCPRPIRARNDKRATHHDHRIERIPRPVRRPLRIGHPHEEIPANLHAHVVPRYRALVGYVHGALPHVYDVRDAVHEGHGEEVPRLVYRVQFSESLHDHALPLGHDVDHGVGLGYRPAGYLERLSVGGGVVRRAHPPPTANPAAAPG